MLTSDGHAGKGYTLTGPESISFAQLADELSEVVGKGVRAVDVPVATRRGNRWSRWAFLSGSQGAFRLRRAFSDCFAHYANNYGDFFTRRR